MPRKFNTIKVSYWENAVEEDLDRDEILIEFYLMTCRECGPTGIFKASPDTIAYYTGIDRGTTEGMLAGMTYTQVQTALKGLQKKTRLKIHPGGWIWVIGKWKHEHTRGGMILKMLDAELCDAPKALKQAFCDTYDYRVSDRVSDTGKAGVSGQVSPEVSGERERERDSDPKDLPSQPDGDNISTVTDKKPTPSKPKRRGVPIEDQKPKTEHGRLVKFWHTEYRAIHQRGYSGDIRKMLVQATRLLKKVSLEDAGAGMTYLLHQPTTQYLQHTFDHFIRKANEYIVAAEKEGYKA